MKLKLKVNQSSKTTKIVIIIYFELIDDDDENDDDDDIFEAEHSARKLRLEKEEFIEVRIIT